MRTWRAAGLKPVLPGAKPLQPELLFWVNKEVEMFLPGVQAVGSSGALWSRQRLLKTPGAIQASAYFISPVAVSACCPQKPVTLFSSASPVPPLGTGYDASKA